MTSDDDKRVSPHARTVDAPAGVDPLVGTRLGQYRIVGRLGQGGMGVVYRAEDEKLRRAVALKVLPDTAGNEERRQRFLREARSAAAVTHANVAVVYQVDEADGRIYIAMELIEGENLRARLERGRLDLATTRELAVQIARGLAAAHEKGIVHRDLKPENVMITPAGVVKLLDFGLAKVGVDTPASGNTPAALAKTATLVTSDEGRIMGTPEYMSPEQAMGEPLDVRSDVFSFGVVLYEMLAGTRPFQGASTGALLIAVARDEPRPLKTPDPAADEGLRAVVMRCLAKATRERFGSAAEIVTALSGQASSGAITASGKDVEPVTRAGAVGRSKAARQVVIGLALLTAAGAVAWRFAPRSATPASQVPVSTAASSPPASSEGLARSTNPEAQRFFEEAMHSYHDGTGQQVALLQGAVRADPGFGSACVRLWWFAAAGNEAHEHADEYHRRVVALEATLSPRDRAFVGWAEDPTAEGMQAKLDTYLARYPDDDIALVSRAALSGDALDRALAAKPTLVPLLVEQANIAQREDALATLTRCLQISPHAVDCLAARASRLDSGGDCAGAEKDLRQWLELQPDSRDARPEFAGVLASQGAPVAAVREALGSDTHSPTGDGQVIFEALVPVFDGDFAEAERLAKDAIERVPSSAGEVEHFVPAATLMLSYTDAGDLGAAGRAAADYLSRRLAWKEPLAYRYPVMVGAAERAGLLTHAEATARLDDAYRSLLAEKWQPEEAWAAVYAYASETPAEASAAVARFDALHAPVPKGWRGASSRTFFLAGRANEARPLLETNTSGCSSTLLVSRNWIHSHLYLGELDEQAGDKSSACSHYAKVLERWGHARPRSVTAEEARAHANKLGCPL